MSTVVWPHRVSPLPNDSARLRRMDVPAEPGPAAAAGTVRIVMAGGGTGGHLYPGLAVAEALQERLGSRLELLWAATPRPVDRRLLGRFGDNYIQQPVQPLVRKITKLWPFWRGWQDSCAYWKREFSRQKVNAVLALGGYAAGPASYVASNRGIPLGVLNPDALPGLANRFLLKRADRIFSQWELRGDLIKHIRGRVLALGCPIRESLLERTREDGCRQLGLDPNRRTLVVTGASLGAKTINDALLLLLAEPDFRAALAGWQVLHLTGLEQVAAVKAACEPIKDVVWRVVDYCDDMASVWAAADLAIARAGASTCAELTACGVPAILLPYPFHKDLHQRHNALELVQAGAALMVDDQKDACANATSIKAALFSLLYDEAARGRMAQAARRVGKPHAARAIADELLTLLNTPTA